MGSMFKFWTFKNKGDWLNKFVEKKRSKRKSDSGAVFSLKQTDYPNQNIQKYGCLLLSIFYIVNPRLLTKANINAVLDLYDVLVQLNYIKEDCTVLGRRRVYEYVAKYYGMTGHKSDLKLTDIRKNLIKYSTEYDHFVVAKGNHVLYDPMQGGEQHE